MPKDLSLYARMHKAICVIQLKLEGQIIRRRPEYKMDDRDMLSRIDYSDMTITIDGVKHELRDKDFPTIDPSDPTRLTESEQLLLEQLTSAFKNSHRLQTHIRYLYSSGSIYLCYNGNLLFHGCVPCNDDGSFMEFDCDGKMLSGREYLDYAECLARKAFYAPEGSADRERGRDFMWFLWCGRNSPIFGRTHITTFERALLEDKSTFKEPKNAYYKYCDNEDFALNILHHFGLNESYSCIVNGHIPVKAKEGEGPQKANGRRVVIDGGFCRAYQSQTGIAGYTMFFTSKRMRIVAHEPFGTTDTSVFFENDIQSKDVIVKSLPQRLLVGDTDTGAVLKERIDDLKALLDAYRKGVIKEAQ